MLDENTVQVLGGFAGTLSLFIMAYFDQRRRKSPDRIEKKINSPSKHMGDVEIPVGAVFETTAIQAGLLQKIYEQYRQVLDKFSDMEKKMKQLEADNSNKTKKIKQLEKDTEKHQRRIKQLVAELEKHGIEVPPDVSSDDKPSE